jgi:hypothetical protein
MFEAILVLCVSVQGPCVTITTGETHPTRTACMEAISLMEEATRVTLDMQGYDMRAPLLRRMCKRKGWPS